jgi:two-component system phosphate regulon sensor histidine kinase PhoR
VMGYFGDQVFDPELGDILSCFAHLAATAIEDAQQHERLRQSEETFKALIDGAVDPVLIFGVDGPILNASRSACEQLGYDRDILTTMNVRDLDMASEARLTDFFNTLKAGGAITYETTLLTRSREPLPVEVRAGNISYSGKLAIQAFIRDISERKRHERQKADLIAMITHDLKAPLSVIMGYTEVIKDQYWADLADFVREGLDAISVSGEKLNSLVEDYLNLSRLEAGMLVMDKKPVSFPALVNRAMDTVTLRSEEKGLRLKVSCPPDLPPVPSDPKHMERAVVNLLTNAVVYTPRGGSITLTCEVDAKRGVMELSVADSGIGINPEELPKIFDKYYRIGKSGGKGVGLGLAIVKSVVEAHGGSVSVESEQGKGSKFTITLPMS